MFSKKINKYLIIIFTALIYLFQLEVMHSQGIIYWIHSISQLLLAIQFFSFLKYDESKIAKISFYFICLLMPYIEWTGYISNLTFALIFFIKNILDNKKITLKSFIKPVFIAILTILSFGIFLGHFALNLNFNDFCHNLYARFFGRNFTVSTVKITDLVKGYLISYQYVLLLCLTLIITILSLKKYRNQLWSLVKEYKYLIIFSILILVENLLLLEHAVTYSFDRLKFTFLLLTVFFIILSTIYKCDKNGKKFITNLLLILLVGISVTNIIEYKKGKNDYIVGNPYLDSDKIVAEYVENNFNHDNSVICNNYGVRGYLELLFHRSIYEFTTYQQAQEIGKNENKRYVIYLRTVFQGNVINFVVKDFETNKQYNMYPKENEIIIEEIDENAEIKQEVNL